MDIIFIRALRISTHIGIFDWEQAIHQTLLLDIEMAADIRKAAAEDTITATIDYDSVSKRLIKFVSENRFQLIETVAEKSAHILLNEFQIKWLRLSVTKPDALPMAKEVGVCIERGEL
jgi:7,8-dihydroneopterin aldolase/epimerase/oxygenase